MFSPIHLPHALHSSHHISHFTLCSPVHPALSLHPFDLVVFLFCLSHTYRSCRQLNFHSLSSPGGMHELCRGATRIDINVVNIKYIRCKTFLGRWAIKDPDTDFTRVCVFKYISCNFGLVLKLLQIPPGIIVLSRVDILRAFVDLRRSSSFFWACSAICSGMSVSYPIVSMIQLQQWIGRPFPFFFRGCCLFFSQSRHGWSFVWKMTSSDGISTCSLVPGGRSSGRGLSVFLSFLGIILWCQVSVVSWNSSINI